MTTLPPLPESILNWEASDKDTGNELHIHFDNVGRWDWCEVADEGKRVYGAMFGDEVEDGSVIAGVISAVAAQASHGAYMAMAAALGLPAHSLRIAVATWSEKQDDLPPAVTFEELRAEIEHMERVHNGEIDCPAIAAQDPYDQTALELCSACGWKTLIPGDCCLNCKRAAQAQPAATVAPPEPMARFCPGCGSVGDLPKGKYRDCCPDGESARVIPEALANRCHDLFVLALTNATAVQPVQPTLLTDSQWGNLLDSVDDIATQEGNGPLSEKALDRIKRSIVFFITTANYNFGFVAARAPATAALPRQVSRCARRGSGRPD